MNQVTVTNQQWLRVLGKGMITLPKKWRQDLGIAEGDIIKARKFGKQVVIETANSTAAPYRIFSDAQIDEFVGNDRLSSEFRTKMDKKISSLQNA